MRPLLVAMSGLPGSGKSALAVELARMLPAVILNKDEVRAALFAPDKIEYSTRQNDQVVEIMLQRAVGLIQAGHTVILDGRPFSRRYQVDALVDFASQHHLTLKMIECVCPDEVIRERLEQDIALGRHPAADRNYALYRSVKAQAEPIIISHLVVDTTQPLEVCLARCLEYLSWL